MFNPKKASDKEVLNYMLGLKSIHQIDRWASDYGFNVEGGRQNQYYLDDQEFKSLKALFLELVTRIRLKKNDLDPALGGIRIVNVRSVDSSILNREGVFYIGGWSKNFRYESPLACKERIGHDKSGTRNEVIGMYKNRLARVVAEEGKFDNAAYQMLLRMARKVKRGNDLVLVCWEFPLKGPAKIVRDIVFYLIKKEVV